MPWLCGRQRGAAMTKALLARGADRTVRANLRKFLDWQEDPAWHVAQNVTALEWGKTFPHQNWVSTETIALIASSTGSPFFPDQI